MDDLRSFISKRHISHLIFDFDQTIARLLLPWDRYHDDIEGILRSYDPTIIEAYIRADIHLNDMQNAYVKAHGVKLVDLFRRHNREFETKKLRGIHPNKNLINFIKTVPEVFLYIWTSNMPDAVISFLKKEKIFHLFKKIVTRNDVSYLKPDSESFDMLYDPKIKKEKYALVGDSDNDELAAKKVSIHFFRVNPLR